MREYFDMLDKGGKDRIITFTAITALMAVFAVGFVWVACAWSTSLTSDTVNKYDEFGMLLDVAAGALNIIAIILFIMAGNAVLIIIELLSYAIFGAFAIRKINFVKEAECILAKRVLTITLIVSTVISLLLGFSDFSILLVTIWPIVFIWVWGYVFYIYALKHKKQK